MSEYQFTNEWFGKANEQLWNSIVPHNEPSKFLEIGSFEGRSICWIMNKFAKQRDIEVHAIDRWSPYEGPDSDAAMVAIDFKSVEERFLHNTSLALKSNPFKIDLHIHKGKSDVELTKLFLNDYDEYFDFIYVDADHTARGCLSDMLLSWKLLAPNGVMCIDDYLFVVKNRPRWDTPKVAVDNFINIFVDDLDVMPSLNSQAWIKKVKHSYEHNEL